MSNKNDNRQLNNKQAERLSKKQARKAYKQMRIDQREDPYWNQPLGIRIYLRVLYATLGFLTTVWIFSTWTSWGIVPQCIFGGLVALSVLLFRQAFPNGLGNIWEWIWEGMYEAALEQELAGKDTKMSSEEIKKNLMERGLSLDKVNEVEKRLKAEAKAREREQKKADRKK